MNKKIYLLYAVVALVLAGGFYYFTRRPSCVQIQMKKWKTDEAVASRMCEKKAAGQ